jgi:hypothetical protein
MLHSEPVLGLRLLDEGEDVREVLMGVKVHDTDARPSWLW